MRSSESIRITVLLVAVSAAFLATVTSVGPAMAPFLCGALLGVSITSVTVALVGWRCSRRKPSGDH